MSEKKFMRQGNMVGKFKVDIGTVYDNFGTFSQLFSPLEMGFDGIKNLPRFLFWLRDFFW